MLDSDLCCGLRWAALEAIGLDHFLEQSVCPVGLPDNPGVYPAIGSLSKEEVKARLRQLPDAGLTDIEYFSTELCEEYDFWLRTAAKNGTDLLSVYY